MGKIKLRIVLLITLFMAFLCNNEYSQSARSMVVEKRLALVIGNAEYIGANSLCFQNGVCPPVNDAKDLSSALKEVGFEVMEGGVNVGLAQMERLLSAFEARIIGGGYSVALFYFAGHGTGLESGNYLYPVDAPLGMLESDVKYKCVNVNAVLDKMNHSTVTTRVVLLDACRDNPYERAWSRSTSEHGLREVDAPDGTFIGYGTKPGSVAQNWSEGNRNGAFTKAILAHINESGNVHEFFPKVAATVRASTNGKQIPMMRSDLTPPIFAFAGGVPPKPVGNEIWVSNVEELLNAIGNDRVIRMRGGVYDLGYFSKAISREFYELRGCNTEDAREVEVVFRNLRNLSLIGEGEQLTRFETPYGSATVMTLMDCSNICIENLVLGHITELTSCSANVINLDGKNSKITLKNCKLFGSGQIGITDHEFWDEGNSWNGEVNISNTDIYDCSLAAVSLANGNYRFESCRIFDNKAEWYVIGAKGEATLDFVACDVFGNETGEESLITFEGTARIKLDRCSFHDNNPASFAILKGSTSEKTPGIREYNSLVCRVKH